MFLIPRATISNLADYEYVYPDEETKVAYSNNEITTQQVEKQSKRPLQTQNMLQVVAVGLEDLTINLKKD